MVKYHSDSERKTAAATWATPSDYKQGFFYMHHPTDRVTHTTAFVTPVVEHWLEREIAQWVHPMKDRSDNPSHHERGMNECLFQANERDRETVSTCPHTFKVSDTPTRGHSLWHGQ